MNLNDITTEELLEALSGRFWRYSVYDILGDPADYIGSFKIKSGETGDTYLDFYKNAVFIIFENSISSKPLESLKLPDDLAKQLDSIRLLKTPNM